MKRRLGKINTVYWNIITLMNPSEVYSQLFDLKFEDDSVVLVKPQGKYVLWEDWKKVVNNLYLNVRDDVIKFSLGDSNLMLDIIKVLDRNVLIVNTEWTPLTMDAVKDYTQDELFLLCLSFFRNVLLEKGLLFKELVRTHKVDLHHESIKYLVKLNGHYVETCNVWRWLLVDFSDIPHYMNSVLSQVNSILHLPIKLNTRLDCTNFEFTIPKNDKIMKVFYDESLSALDQIVKLFIQKKLYDKTGVKVNFNVVGVSQNELLVE